MDIKRAAAFEVLSKKLVVEERAQEMRPIVWKARIFVAARGVSAARPKTDW